MARVGGRRGSGSVRRAAGAILATVIASSSLSLLAALAPAPTPAGAVTPESHTVDQVTGQTAWTASQISEAGKGDTDNVHGCALTTASPSGIKCWGYNQQGELGIGNTTATYDYPVNVGALATSAGTSPAVVTSDPQALAVGDSSVTCVIVNTSSITGGVQCWGNNGQGELGNNTTTQEDSPVEVVCGTATSCTTVSSTSYLSGVTAIAAGGGGNSYGTVCAVASGGVFCWGNNGNGQIGNGSTGSKSVPTQAIATGSGVGAVSVGYEDSCAVYTLGTNSGEAECWGYNQWGDLGVGNTNQDDSPEFVDSSGSTRLTGVVAISNGYQETCVLLTSGAVECDGGGGQGQIGNNGTSNEAYPTQVSGITSGATSVSVGFEDACAVVSGGVECWGYNGNGGLGNDTTTEENTPVKVLAPNSVGSAALYLSGVPSSNYGVLSAGDQATCVDSNATSAQTDCWGRDDNGGLGDGGTGGGESNTSIPVYVNGAGPNLWSAVAVSTSEQDGNTGSHTCEVTTAGAVRCWGYDSEGQLGNGVYNSDETATPRTSTEHGAGGEPGGGHQPGYRRGGPIVAAAGTDSCVIVNTATVTGGVECWGYNGDGELGIGSTNSNTNGGLALPQPVEGVGGSGYLSGVVAISSSSTSVNGGGYVCAVLSASSTPSGGVVCWGHNSNGELGNNTTTQEDSPVQVVCGASATCSSGSLSGVSTLAVGDNEVCAIQSGGLSCWGLNNDGQLGIGNTTQEQTPVVVKGVGGSGTLSGVTSVGAGDGGSAPWSLRAGWTAGGTTATARPATAVPPRRSTPSWWKAWGARGP